MIIKYLQDRFVLTEKGARDVWHGILLSTLLNLAFMLPICYLFFFLTEQIDTSYAGGSHGIWFYLLLALALAVVMGVINHFQYGSTYITVYDESAKRRISLAEKLRRLPLSFFGERNLSDLTSTMMEDSTQLEQTFSHAVPQLYASFLSVLIIGVGMAVYDWRLALALFWVVPFALLVLVLARRSLSRDFDQHYRVKRGVTETIQEGLECVQEIKSYSGEEAYLRDLNQRLDGYEKELTRVELVSGSAVNLAAVLLKLGMPTVLLVGAWLLSMGELSLFVYLAFLLASAMVYEPVQDVCNNLAILTFLDVRVQRMREMEEMPTQGGSSEVALEGFDIDFRHVAFSYEEGKQVLRDVSFTAKQGEVTALVGPSGGGKSTTAKLAARFWDIEAGEIRIGGVDVSTIEPEALLKYFSIVFQDVVLFNASIADNIRIGKRDATDEEVRRAAELAQCDDFIRRMPEGYDTIIGENGETLSGGERQRISIARALLKDAPIILLDEATASLDVENEAKIQAGISQLVRNKTVLVIAHRMRTVRNADHIVVLRDGVVSEEGRPEELLRQDGDFARMVALQMES